MTRGKPLELLNAIEFRSQKPLFLLEMIKGMTPPPPRLLVDSPLFKFQLRTNRRMIYIGLVFREARFGAIS